MNYITPLCALALALALLTGCTSLPSGNAALEQARNDYESAQADPGIRKLAKGDLRRATDAMELANMAWADHAEPAAIGLLAELVSQWVVMARETAARRTAELACAGAPPGSACQVR